MASSKPLGHIRLLGLLFHHPYVRAYSLCLGGGHHARCRAEGHSEEEGQGERGERVERNAGPPGPRPSQRRAFGFPPTRHPCSPFHDARLSSFVA